MPSHPYAEHCILCALPIGDQLDPHLAEIVMPFVDVPEQRISVVAHGECLRRVLHPEIRLPTYQEFQSEERAEY